MPTENAFINLANNLVEIVYYSPFVGVKGLQGAAVTQQLLRVSVLNLI